MKKLITISLIFLTLVSFYLFINNNEKKINALKIVKNCNELNYEEHQLNSIDNFSNFEIDLVIENERKWKKIILNTHLSGYEDRSFTYDANYTNAKVILKNKFGLKCLMKAKIKPHGDLLDHYRDFKPGYDPIYVLPSLKVKLDEGNIFGIVEFRLLVPRTRQEGNEIFVTTLFQKLGFYAPRTTYVNLNYNNKKYKFLFQEKLNKEFLEINSLHEGLFFAGDERFSFKYENVSTVDGKLVEEKEIGISKFRITEIKFLKKNQIFIKPAINTLEALNVSSHFYSSDIKQSLLIDYFTTQKDKIYENYFKNIPEFDAMMYAVGADHGLSRDDRRFYFDFLNNNFIPIYNDGAVRIFSKNKFVGSNIHSDIEKRLKLDKKFSNAAKIGALDLTKKIDEINPNDLKQTLNQRGLNVPISDLNLILKLIKKNLILLSNLSDDQIIKVSNLNQHPLINKKAIDKNIKASYLLMTDSGYQKCDLLLSQCIDIKLDQQELLLALKQNLEDNEGNKLIFLGKLSEFKKLKSKTSENSKVYTFDNVNFKIFGEVTIEINKDIKNIKFTKKKNKFKNFVL